MITNLDPQSALFLTDINRVQDNIAQASDQVSSGLKITVAADAPDQIGTLLQLRANLQHNTQVQSNLTLAQSDAGAADDALSASIQLMDSAVSLATQGATATTNAAGRATIAIALHDVFADSKNITSAVVDEYARPLNKPGFRDLLRRLLVEYFSPEFMAMTQHYDQIRAPTQLIWGAGDKWVPTAFGPKLQALIAGSRLTIVPHAGHLPQQERPDIVNPLLVEFLKEK